MQIAILPEVLERVTIADMQVGETGYTVPWAIMIDRGRGCWIRGDYSFRSQPCGTARMKITRSQGGFAVEVPRGERFDVDDTDMEWEIKHWNALPVKAIVESTGKD